MVTVVRVGVLGCANIAGRRMLPGMLDQPLVDLVAVASRDEVKAKSFGQRFGCDAVTGYDALLARDDIDAVYIPLPLELHVEWTLKALRAGKHVLCEKPFALAADEAKVAVEAARERGLLLMESFMFVYHSQHAFVRKLIADGAIGEPRVFTSEFAIPRQPTGYASTLPEVGCYPIRAARFFLGEDWEILGSHRAEADGGALLRSSSGVTAHLTYGLDHSYRTNYALWGSEGNISLQRAFSTPDTHPPVVRVERQDHVAEHTLRTDSAFVNISGEFARLILEDADFTPYGDDLLRQAEIVTQVC